MKTLIFLLALVLCGCASQPTALEQATANVDPSLDISEIEVFLEEPSIEYEELGRVGMTGRAEHPADVMERILVRAAEMGADGVIVHSVRNQGRVGRGNDNFGTGGGDGYSVFQIQATAIRYID